MTSALRWRWVVSTTPRPLYPRERPGTHCTGGWVGPKGRSGRVRKFSPPTGIRSPDRPARSESLYRLSYRGPLFILVLTASKCCFAYLRFESDETESNQLYLRRIYIALYIQSLDRRGSSYQEILKLTGFRSSCSSRP